MAAPRPPTWASSPAFDALDPAGPRSMGGTQVHRTVARTADVRTGCRRDESAGGQVNDVVGRGTLLRYTARLVGQVWPGDTLTATLTVTSIDDGVAELSIRTVNQDGAEVLVGSARVCDHPA